MRRIVIIIAVIAELVALSIIASAAPIVVNFEDRTNGEKIYDVYAQPPYNLGIEFINDPIVRDYSKESNPSRFQGFAYSGSKAIEQCYGDEFCTKPIQMEFTKGQRYVKVWVGYSSYLKKQKTVMLTAFDSAGVQIDQVKTTLEPSDNPIPIQTYLVVKSESANIHSVTANFEPDAYGNSYSSYLAVDDVEFDMAGPAPPCSSTQSPSIKITKPANGDITDSNGFSLEGSILTTGLLENAILMINGKVDNSIDLISTSAISRNGGALKANINGMLSSGFNTITIKAQNCKGSSEASTIVVFNPIDYSKTSIKCIGLEVTQGIQTLWEPAKANTGFGTWSLPLIAGKPTIVRAYLQVEGPISKIHNVRGTLYAKPALGSVYPPVLGNPLPPYSIESLNSITADSSNDIDSKRSSIDGSLIFELPESWTKEREIYFTINVYPHGGYYDNLDPSGFPAIIYFKNAPPVQLVLWNIPYYANGIWYWPKQTDFESLVSLLRRMYPTGSVLHKENTITTAFGGIPGADFDLDDVDDRLIEARFLTTYDIDTQQRIETESPAVLYYGLINNSLWNRNYPWAGMAMMGTCVASGMASDYFAGAHEIGHLYSRAHAACPNQHAADPDPNYPDKEGKIGYPWFGFDVGDPNNGAQMKVYNPLITYDLMSYCRWNEWISAYTYYGILNMLNTINKSYPISKYPFSLNIMSSVSNDSLIVRGKLNLTDNTTKLFPFLHQQGLKLTPRPANSSFSIDLLDSIGKRLASYPFDPKLNSEYIDNRSRHALIAEVIPYINGTSQVVITKDGMKLASRNASANVPYVRILHPNGGESLENKVNVTWQASDADGDKLVYTLLYSADAGKTWQAVAVDIEKTNCVVNLKELPGSNQVLFKVIATDGFNTGSSESQAVFRVENNPPRVEIISPGNNSSSSNTQTIVLYGDAFDREDGYLDGKSLRWTLDTPGTSGFQVLGDNRSTYVTGLSPGDHIITLSAIDSNRKISMTSILLHITSVAPVADAGLDRIVEDGCRVELNGSNSSGFKPLDYKWEFVSKPYGSKTNLSNTNSVQTDFTADFSGVYLVQLVVKDPTGAVGIDRVNITSKQSCEGCINGCPECWELPQQLQRYCTAIKQDCYRQCRANCINSS